MTLQLEIDRFGRVLIPKALREALALHAGETLEAEITGGVLQLRPLPRPAELVEHAGRLVLTAADTQAPISDGMVDEFRAAYAEDILGQWS